MSAAKVLIEKDFARAYEENHLGSLPLAAAAAAAASSQQPAASSQQPARAMIVLIALVVLRVSLSLCCNSYEMPWVPAKDPSVKKQKGSGSKSSQSEDGWDVQWFRQVCHAQANY
jgi:hypothetical protein